MVSCVKHSLLKTHHLTISEPTTGAWLLQGHQRRDRCQCAGPLRPGEGWRLATAECHTPSKKASHYRSNHLHKAKSQPHAKNLGRNNDAGCCLVCPTVWTQLLHYWSLYSFTPSIHSSNGNNFIKFQPSELFRKTILDRALESSLPISLSLAIHQSCQELVGYTAVFLTACYWRVNKI